MDASVAVPPNLDPRVARLGRAGLKRSVRWLQTGDPTATIDRLFTSQHVRDLRVIAKISTLIVVALIAGTVIQAILEAHAWVDNHEADPGLITYLFRAPAPHRSFFSFDTLYYMDRNTGRDLLSLAALFAAFGAVLAWAYRAGSARLGVVDLFACEISTLCRAAAVVGAVGRFVARFEEGPAGTPLQPPTPSRPFASAENYFPVFEGNSRDLESLDERTVVHITEFYTYMKAVRDIQRTLSQTMPGPADLSPLPLAGPWHEAARDVVYMLYLALESARHAIDRLVEFEPDKVERTIVILNSELEAYGFLCGQFPDEDARRGRLRFREQDYRKLVETLRKSIEDKPGLDEITDEDARELAAALWEQARLLLPKLKERCRLALPGA